MAKDKNEETRTSIDNLNESLTGIEQKVQNNQKLIMWLTLGAAAVVAVVFIYIYAIHKPSVDAANQAIGQADTELFAGNDSIALEQYKLVSEDYGHDAGNRAALNAAILLYQNKKYDEALTYLKKYDTKETVIGAAAISLEGDCYVNLGQLEQAIDCYKKAVKLSDNNPAYTPFFLLKEATVYREMKKWDEEAAIYKTIRDDYPAYAAQNRIDVEKYIKRAEGGIETPDMSTKAPAAAAATEAPADSVK